MRKVLNFGHTIGHAVESQALENNGDLLHGEAVAIGMAVEAILSNKTNFLTDEDLVIVIKRLKASFPLHPIEEKDLSDLINWMRNDKKNNAGKINFSLLKNIGEASFDNECSVDEIESAIKEYNQCLD